MTPFDEIISFDFHDEKLQERFAVEALHAYETLEKVNSAICQKVDNDLGVLRKILCDLIHWGGMLGKIQNDMTSWEKIAMYKTVEHYKKQGIGEREASQLATHDIMGIIELARLPEIYWKTIKEQKAMIKTIMGQELGGGYNG